MKKSHTHFICGALLLMASLTACNRKKTNTFLSSNPSYPITIDLSKAVVKNNIYLSEIADSITYIPVNGFQPDYDAPIFIKFGKEVFLSPGSIATSDQNKELVCFDRSGKQLRKIGQVGRGPAEYLGVFCAALDEENAVAYIIDGVTNRILKYSLEGEFLGVISYPKSDRICKLTSHSGHLYIFYSNDRGDAEYSCIVLNAAGDTVGKLQNYTFYNYDASLKNHILTNYATGEDMGVRTIFGGVSVYIFENKVHVANKNDTLFMVDNGQFRPKYVFTGIGRTPTGIVTQEEYNNKVPIWGIYETSDKVYFDAWIKDQHYPIVSFDKNTQEVVAYKNGVINDLDELDDSRFSAFLVRQFNNESITTRPPFNMEKLREKVSPEKYLRIANMIDSQPDEGHSTLMVVHFPANSK